MLCGLSVFQGLAERATILVQQLPVKDQKNRITGHAMTLTSPSVPEQYADSHTSATGALSWDTVNNNASNTTLQDHPHWPQLNELTFQPVMPVQVDRLE